MDGFNPYEDEADAGFDEDLDGSQVFDTDIEEVDEHESADEGDVQPAGEGGNQKDDGSDPQSTEPRSSEEDGQEEVDYSFLREDWRPENPKDPASYEKAYRNVIDSMKSEDFAQALVERHRDVLAAEETEFANAKEHIMAFRNNPREYIRTHMPEFAAETGVDVGLSAEEMNKALNEHMSQEFGEDWEDAYDERERFKLGSLSNKIMSAYESKATELRQQQQSYERAQQERIARLAEQKDQGNSSKELTPQETESILAEEYKRFEQLGISREDFDSFVDEAKGSSLNFLDLYRAKNFERLVQEASDKAYQEGKRGVAQSIRKVSKTSSKETPDVQPRQEEPRRGREMTKDQFFHDYYDTGFNAFD